MNHDLNKLLDFAKKYGISININYSESEDVLEIETVSPAAIECLYIKRCSDVDRFIYIWEKQINENRKTDV